MCPAVGPCAGLACPALGSCAEVTTKRLRAAGGGVAGGCRAGADVTCWYGLAGAEEGLRGWFKAGETAGRAQRAELMRDVDGVALELQDLLGITAAAVVVEDTSSCTNMWHCWSNGHVEAPAGPLQEVAGVKASSLTLTVTKAAMSSVPCC